MHDPFRVQVANRHNQLSGKKKGLLFVKSFLSGKNFIKFPTSHEGHYKVKPFLILKQELKVD